MLINKIAGAGWGPQFRREVRGLSRSAILALVILAATPGRIPGADGSAIPQAGAETAPIRLAVCGFAVDNDRPQLREQNQILLDLLTARLSQIDRIQLVERKEIDSIIQELSLSLSQVSRPAEAVRAGKLLRADWLLLGSFVDANETNFVIAKIVDARTGIIRDLTAVSLGNRNARETTDAIAEFVKASLTRGRSTEPRAFIGIGGFEDLSINNRFPEFRKNLRAYLEQQLQGTRYAVVERALVNPLLTELRLNLGGLAGSPQPDPSAQPAFLLVDGVYQSYHDESAKLNLVLRVQEIGGAQQLYTLKAPPGRELDEKILSLLRGALNDLHRSQSQQSRKAEAAIQFARGLERSRLDQLEDNYYSLGGYPYSIEPQKRLKNITEAIEAFQAALLLDPDCVEAKFDLAICLLDKTIGKKEPARDYLSEVIATSTNVSLVISARRQLACSYEEENDGHALDLLLALDRDMTEPDQHATVLETIVEPTRRLFEAGKLSTAKAVQLLDQLLTAECQRIEVSANPIPKFDLSTLPFKLSYYFQLYLHVCLYNPRSAEDHLDGFLPQLSEKHPMMAPYIWPAYATWQHSRILRHLEHPAEPMAPVPGKVMERVRASLELCRDHPERVPHIGVLCVFGMPQLLEWSVINGEYATGELAADVLQRANASASPEFSQARALQHQWITNPTKPPYYTGFCKRELGKWQEALASFEAAQKQSEAVVMESDGPWGKKGTRVCGSELIADCRQHLSGSAETNPSTAVRAPLPEAKDTIPFTLGEPVLTLTPDQSIMFACDGDRVWLADASTPLVYDKRNQSLIHLDWPIATDTNINCICVDQQSVWWGTQGRGLIEMDKQTKRCRVYGEKDGLLLPFITSLAVDKDKLWIGFGHEFSGAIGYLDLRTRKFTGFTADLEAQRITNRIRAPIDSNYLKSPPRSPVVAICPDPGGDLWLLSSDIGIRQYSAKSNQWYSFFRRTAAGWHCMTAGPDYLAIAAEFEQKENLMIHTMSDGQTVGIPLREWTTLKLPTRHSGPATALPAVAVAADGDRVWVGGWGYLALVDLKGKRVERFCNFGMRTDDSASPTVRHLELDGRNLWVAIDNKLYELPRPAPR